MFTVTVPPAVTPLYGVFPGLVQLAGRPFSASWPPPTGTFPIEYDPLLPVWTAGSAEPPVGVAAMETPASPPPALLETVPTTEPVVGGVVQVTVMATVTEPPLARPVYGVAPGLAQEAGRLLSVICPSPPSTGTVTAYWPLAPVVKGADADPPVGVTTTDTLPSVPPRLLLIVPLTLPVGTLQTTEKLAVAL